MRPPARKPPTPGKERRQTELHQQSVKTSVEQMEAYAKRIADAAEHTSDFTDENP